MRSNWLDGNPVTEAAASRVLLLLPMLFGPTVQ